MANKVAGVMDRQQAVEGNYHVTKARGEAVAPTKPRPPTPLSAGIGLAYEWFLEMPVVIVLTVLWVVGVALLGSCALALYMAGSMLWYG